MDKERRKGGKRKGREEGRREGKGRRVCQKLLDLVEAFKRYKEMHWPCFFGSPGVVAVPTAKCGSVNSKYTAGFVR